MMKLLDSMRPMQAQGLRIFALLIIACLGARLGATSYQGISTTNPGAAIYLTNQTATAGDSYTGFVSFSGGLRMPSSGGANVTLGTVGRLSGPLYWNNSFGMLVLADDLICNSSFWIEGVAAIRGGGYSLKLTGSLRLNDLNKIAVYDNLVIDGQGQTLTLAGNSTLSLAANVSMTLRNMTLVLADPTHVPISQPNTPSSTVTLDNVNVVMSTAATFYSFSSDAGEGTYPGRLCIENDVRFSGPGQTFLCNSAGLLTICPGATLTFDSGTTLQYRTGSSRCLCLADQTSTFRLNNCTLNVPTGYGMQLLKGRVEFDNQVFIENGGQSSFSNGLILGDGLNTANNVAVSVLSGANVIVDGVMYYNQA